MKITIEIPDTTILAMVSLATLDKENPLNIRMGVRNIVTQELKDGNTIDCRPEEHGSEDTE